MSTPEKRHQAAGDKSEHSAAMSIYSVMEEKSRLYPPTFGDFYEVVHHALIAAELGVIDGIASDWRPTRDSGARKKNPLTVEPVLKDYSDIGVKGRVKISPRVGSLAIVLFEARTINPRQQLYQVHAPEELIGYKQTPNVTNTEPSRSWSAALLRTGHAVNTPLRVVMALHATLIRHCERDELLTNHKTFASRIRLREQLNQILWPEEQ